MQKFKLLVCCGVLVGLFGCATTKKDVAYDNTRPQKVHTGIQSLSVNSEGELIADVKRYSLLREYHVTRRLRDNLILEFGEPTNNPDRWRADNISRYHDFEVIGLTDSPLKFTSIELKVDLKPYINRLKSTNRIEVICKTCDKDSMQFPAHMSPLNYRVSLDKNNEQLKKDLHLIETKISEKKKREVEIEKQRARDKAIQDKKNTEEKERIARNGDNSPDDLTCKKFGFKPQTSGYAECRLKLEVATRQAAQQQQQYEDQKRQYDAQVAAIQKERDRQRALKQLEMGLRMMGGQSAPDAALATAGMPPLPKPPAPINQTIIMPGGRIVNCHTAGTVTNCF